LHVGVGRTKDVASKEARWCDGVRPRAENTLPSSLNTPAGAALLSSEVLNVLTLPAHSGTVVEPVSDNDSEGDEEEDDDDSDNDLEIVSEPSGTVDITDAVSGGTEAPKRPRSC
jgi:hypothetical protein